jgi:predicted transcriptional regulator
MPGGLGYRVSISGGRVIEALATGRTGTYIGHSRSGGTTDLESQARLPISKLPLNSTQQKIADFLADGPRTVPELQVEMEMSVQGIRKALNGMRQAGVVEQIGDAGRRTIYRLLN